MTNFLNNRRLLIKPVFTIGAENTNAINVAIQLTDRLNGGDLTERAAIQWYLSADTNGDAIATAPSGGIAIGTDGLLIEHSNNLAGVAISESDGDIDVTITESTAKSFYLILIMPDGKLYSSGAITFA
jgi:hypothetical protein